MNDINSIVQEAMLFLSEVEDGAIAVDDVDEYADSITQMFWDYVKKLSKV